MAHRQQALIDKLLEESAEERDHSLQGKARERALKGSVPKTMTPWEWEQYYDEHGVPEAHRPAAPRKTSDTSGTPWWRRWLRLRD